MTDIAVISNLLFGGAGYDTLAEIEEQIAAEEAAAQKSAPKEPAAGDTPQTLVQIEPASGDDGSVMASAHIVHHIESYPIEDFTAKKIDTSSFI